MSKLQGVNSVLVPLETLRKESFPFSTVSDQLYSLAYCPPHYLQHTSSHFVHPSSHCLTLSHLLPPSYEGPAIISDQQN